jgi:hypothetical protein
MSTAATIAITLLGGVTGSALTYGLSWLRERRRTLDAYRAPQREAIAGIVVASHELFMGVANFRRDHLDNRPASDDQPRMNRSQRVIDERFDQFKLAFITFDQAHLIALLTIVDEHCYEALDAVSKAFGELRAPMKRIAGTNPSPEEGRAVSGELADLAKRLGVAIAFLVAIGRARVSPVQRVVKRPQNGIRDIRRMRQQWMDIELPEQADDSAKRTE